MKLLIIGYSNLLKSRIIPVLNKIDSISEINIAKYKEQEWDDDYKKLSKPVKLYDNFDSALRDYKGELVYISTTNHSHYTWAKKSLEYGFHTIVDKPATLSLTEAEHLIEIAQQKKSLLSESTVYLYHPQMITLKQHMQEKGFETKNITFLFSFPPMNKENFRYKKELGGGAILDTGSYIASICRFLINEMPETCTIQSNYENGIEVETSYSVLLKFPGGKSLIGYSGFNTEYINRINILGKDFIINIDRVFTIPETLENIINVRSKNETYELKVEAGNLFEKYFEYIFDCMLKKSFNNLYNDLLFDARIRNLLKQ